MAAQLEQAVAPALTLTLPAGQSVQADALAELNLPAVQAVQADAPEALLEPVGQLEQADPAVLNLPAVQAVQAKTVADTDMLTAKRARI